MNQTNQRYSGGSDQKDVNDLLKQLSESFVWVEKMNMRVGEVWLHPFESAILKKDKRDFDALAQRTVVDLLRREDQRAECIGYLWGAAVFESDLVVPRHTCIVPDGWTVKDPSCCMPL